MSKNPIKKILRSGEGKKLKLLQDLVPDINELEQDFQKLSDEDLRAKTSEFKSRVTQGEGVNSLIIEAFAVVREASKRVLGQRHYDVQLIGGAALHFGWVAEMKTGEGKTLVATLPAFYFALYCCSGNTVLRFHINKALCFLLHLTHCQHLSLIAMRSRIKPVKPALSHL